MLSRTLQLGISRTNIVSIGLLSILAGLIWARFGAYTSVFLMTISFLLIPLFAKSRWPAIVAAMLIGLNIGLWRGHHFWQQEQIYRSNYDQKVRLKGRVSDDPAYSYKGQTEFHIGNVSVVSDFAEQDLVGRVRVRGFGAVGVIRGDYIQVSGKLMEGFGNRQGSISYGDIEIVGRQQSAIEDLRAKFFAGVNTALPEPNASLGLGFLVGLRTLLPEQLLDQLSATGLTHIVAVSGYNLTILVRLMRRIFAKKSVYLSVATSAGLIVGFLLVTGISPSIFRAAVVSSFALSAWYFGRSIKPILLILLSAAITAMINPFYAWYDIGWYLSFAAFFGVLVLAPLITKRLFRQRPKLVGQVAVETICAQLMALPIIAAIFGELSLISIIANVIIVPLIPLAMLLTFIAGLVGMIGPIVSGWFAAPANLLLTFMTDSVAVMAELPWALREVNVNWTEVAFFYTIVLLTALILRMKTREPLSGTEIIE